MDEKFTIKEMLDFCINWEHGTAFDECLQFIKDFTLFHDIDISAEIEDAKHKWYEFHKDDPRV